MSGGRHAGPRIGIRSRLALEKLHAIGGQGTASTWMVGAVWAGSVRSFELAVAQLVKQEVVHERAGVYGLTDAGLDLLGIPVDAPKRMAPVIVGPRYSPGILPLAARHIPKVRMMREGAFDYRDIPSLHGTERVAFQSSLKVSGGDAQG